MAADPTVFPTHGDDRHGARARRRRGRTPARSSCSGSPAAGKSLAEISLELRRSEFETASLIFELHARGVVVAGEARRREPGRGPGRQRSRRCSTLAYQRLQEKRYDAALKAYEEVLALDRLNQNAKKGLIAAMEARERERQLQHRPAATRCPR